MSDRYDWKVSYDGETFSRPERGWVDVDVDTTVALYVYRIDNDNENFMVVCPDPGMRPIFYQTVEQVIKMSVNEEGQLESEKQPAITKFTVFGWQKTINGKNVKSLTRINHLDDSIQMLDHDPAHAK